MKHRLKKSIVFIFALITILVACKKSSSDNSCVSTNGVPTTAEISALKSFITSSSISATQDPAGFFYQIISTGYGTSPSLTDSVSVAYKGTLTNGQVFDSTATGESRKFLLGSLIKGWQQGIPLIKRGGEIILYLPPSLAYGCNAIGPIQAGSNLIFNVRLLNF